MNEVVKYNNYMNKLYFKKFKAVEYDLLMALCAKLRDQGTNTIVFSFAELKNFVQDTKHTNSNFVENLKSMNRKLMDIICEIEIDGKIIMFVLFPVFEIDTIKQELTVCVNERFKFILNELIKNFTRFDLSEFLGLKSKYSKVIYRLLKQYRTTGRYEVKIDDFRNKIDCPESYSNKYVMDLVIKPVLKELQNYFNDLKCNVQYSNKRGRPVIGYIFTFTPENTKSQPDQDQVHKKKTSNSKNSSNGYADFPQRTYDYDVLEKELLNNQTREKCEPDHDAERLDKELQEQLKSIGKEKNNH